jgi:hypothetical protein
MPFVLLGGDFEQGLVVWWRGGVFGDVVVSVVVQCVDGGVGQGGDDAGCVAGVVGGVALDQRCMCRTGEVDGWMAEVVAERCELDGAAVVGLVRG